MKFTPSIVLDAPAYYVNHFNGKCNSDKCLILRDLGLESDSEYMNQSFGYMNKPVNILDLTNNKISGLPNLKERTDIHTLLIARNRVSYIDGKLLPKRLENLVLGHNNITSLDELNGLKSGPKTLTNLCLRANDVCHMEGYREYIIKLMPHLQVLDFTKVTDKERKAAKSFELPKHKKQKTGDAKHKEPYDESVELINMVVKKMTKEEREDLKKQLANATTLDEILRLEKLLSGGVE
ncbi:hypothetical protein Kpol_1002p44 [Vanderwaltozyma polyspora DSM 70294]|uniref:U2 small nuclear ribonucleoprotein A' n=1 Tax=Vanderwaltozyma polyspora (strain ATCC 22028 / DSM 70294 / BCRC 21397 / CBS 2163 / NBRC 10782 / NRRL Y-8283 / UCD 57-17) TaxID=436907 RepID=A7TE75_VANPO|nr:uncharacterized protein Kpol_1002p44 [Vanderwaltozyma polyspora DSM 70294]EDO19397.1 hypothetical protein Kpol_1002p44 [Vanderwaltozyma polyspora DSM 70294]